MCFSSFACPAVFCQSCTDGEEEKKKERGSYRVVVCLSVHNTYNTHTSEMAGCSCGDESHERTSEKRQKPKPKRIESLFSRWFLVYYIFSRSRRRLLSFSLLHSRRNYPKVTWLRHRLAAAAHSRDLILCFLFFFFLFLKELHYERNFFLSLLCAVFVYPMKKKKNKNIILLRILLHERMMEKIPFTLPALRSIDTHTKHIVSKTPGLTSFTRDNFDVMISWQLWSFCFPSLV